MSTLSSLVWATALLTPTLALADALSQNMLREHCSARHFSQTELHRCIEQTASHSALNLAQAETRMEQALRQWDETLPHIEQARTQLNASRHAFRQYRDAQCKLLSSLSGGAAGNTHSTLYLACTAELNQRRADALQQTLPMLPPK